MLILITAVAVIAVVRFLPQLASYFNAFDTRR